MAGQEGPEGQPGQREASGPTKASWGPPGGSGGLPEGSGVPVPLAAEFDLEAVCQRALSLLVESFDFPEAEARHRLNLWRARQHDLAGQALEVTLPGMTAEEREAALLQWALQGLFLERDLRKGADELGFDLVE